MFRRFLLPALLLGLAAPGSARAGDGVRLDLGGPDARLRIEARIGGRPAALALDTGADVSYVLFRQFLGPLGLTAPAGPAEPHPVAGQAPFVLTDQAPAWTLLGGTVPDLRVPVVTAPSRLSRSSLRDYAGLVGWPAVRDNIWILDLADGRVGVAARVPEGAAGWSRWRIATDLRLLSLQPLVRGSFPRLLIDTGSPDGVLLPGNRWRAWRAAHAGQPLTLAAGVMLGQGWRATELGWAATFPLGGVALRDVPVQEEDEAYARLAPGEAVVALGLAGLARLDLVLDGPRRLAYLRPHAGPSPDFPYNRLGAEFLPGSAAHSPWEARVAAGTPAAAAGIRQGDELVTVDGRTFAAPDGPALFWERPAGTACALVLRRGGELRRVTVILRDLHRPEGAPGPAAGLAYAPGPVVLRRNDDEIACAAGAAAAARGDPVGALADFDRAIALDPAFAQAYAGRGDVHALLGDDAAAVPDYDRALALDPWNPAACDGRGAARYRLGNLVGAVADFSREVALAPRDPAGYAGRGDARLAAGDFSGAVGDFRRAVQLAPGRLESRFDLSLTLRRLRRPDDSGLAAAVARAPAGWTRDVGLYLLGRMPEAELLAIAVEGDVAGAPWRRCQADYCIGMTRLLQGDAGAASAAFSRCAGAPTADPDRILALAELARLAGPLRSAGPIRPSGPAPMARAGVGPMAAGAGVG